LRDKILSLTNENTTEPYETLKRAYEEHAVLTAQICKCQILFWMTVRMWKTNRVQESLARQKAEENVTKVRAFVWSDRRLTVRMVGCELTLIHQTVHDIFTEELVMRTLGCCITSTPAVTLPFPSTEF
jgi:uncharacterized SAM-dependent methyltransferase